MSGVKRLRPVERLMRQQQEQAAADLARAQGELQRSEGQLTSILGMRQEYQQRLVTSGTSGTIEAARLRDFNAFLGRLDEAVAQQRQGIAEQQQRVVQLHQRWLQHWEAHRRIERVIEQRLDQERSAAQRREQREADETARLFFQSARRRSSDSE
ncbi:flagellar export protein FliJ [Halorhodospira abdelmalekii]|uniref:flagellar export protein FliJ n=1 Tax=Halorhodospira abdelmalekii TaxID=421629 RepID=UPI001902F57B|nr:flagellar export protein FliJ [Halorhodospira abdelmalekii]MBK1735671.1 flagellar export protein FliJ [Halorhodospira abdelmalekii]